MLKIPPNWNLDHYFFFFSKRFDVDMLLAKGAGATMHRSLELGTGRSRNFSLLLLFSSSFISLIFYCSEKGPQS